jgi:hypothetical protein
MPGAPLPALRGPTALVCCYCRRFRDGADRWTRDRPPDGHHLSHVICPACLAAHFPEVRPPDDGHRQGNSSA